MYHSTTLPYLSGESIQQIDQWMVADYFISVPQMMECAGLAVAQFARDFFGGSVINAKILIGCGKGNNGADGLVAARHLSNWGANVTVLLSDIKHKLSNYPIIHLKALEKLPVSVFCFQEQPVSEYETAIHKADVLIDGLLGFGIKGDPRENTADMIRLFNESKIPILSIDVPSGLDSSLGTVYAPCIQATSTLTLGLPKAGFLNSKAKPYVGTLYLGDIGIPPALIREKLGYQINTIFQQSTIIKL